MTYMYEDINRFIYLKMKRRDLFDVWQFIEKED